MASARCAGGGAALRCHLAAGDRATTNPVLFVGHVLHEMELMSSWWFAITKRPHPGPLHPPASLLHCRQSRRGAGGRQGQCAHRRAKLPRPPQGPHNHHGV